MPVGQVGATMTVAYLGGIAARSERYMRDHWARAKGFTDDAALLASARIEEAAHVAAKRAAGLDLVAPACTRWEDLLRPLCDGKGVEVGALTRYFETNTFYRQPTVTGRVAMPSGWDAAFQLPPGTPWVLTLPSPWDAAVRSRDDRGTGADGPAALALEVAEALRPVVDAAVKKGAQLVRFHDPSILYRRAPVRDAAACAEALRVAARGNERVCTLHLTNGDPYAFPEVLQGNPLAGLSVEDAGRAPPAGLRLANSTRLSLALVRGEDSIIEQPAAIAARAQEIARGLGLDAWGLTNGWDLDHVPHAIAQRKVAALGQARLLLREVAA
jgi:methionine synthase II (cobalamin-independent)